MQINIVPTGRIDQDILERISDGLAKTFPYRIGIVKEIPRPEDAYNPQRRQYISSKILGKIKSLKTEEAELILGNLLTVLPATFYFNAILTPPAFRLARSLQGSKVYKLCRRFLLYFSSSLPLLQEKGPGELDLLS